MVETLVVSVLIRILSFICPVILVNIYCEVKKHYSRYLFLLHACHLVGRCFCLVEIDDHCQRDSIAILSMTVDLCILSCCTTSDSPPLFLHYGTAICQKGKGEVEISIILIVFQTILVF